MKVWDSAIKQSQTPHTGPASADQKRYLLETIKSQREEGRLTFQVDDVQSYSTLLITAQAERGRAHQLMNAALD